MPRPRLTPLRLLKAVLWSFVGVRRSADAARDIEAVPPHLLILAGVVVAAIIVVGIVTVVRLIIGQSVQPPVVQPQAGRAENPAAVVSKSHAQVVVVDTMQERVRPCTVCHGNATEATPDGFSPRIAGKPAGYLFNQLVSFRDGRRTYPPMVYLVQYMTDDYLREMASYFAQLELPYPPPAPLALSAPAAARAQQLVEQGGPGRSVPACTECHGTTLTGTEPAIPGLVGLPKDYITAQFGAWRNGKLRSVPPDCMAEVARRLAPEDVVILASWLASQPVRPDMKTQPLRRELPLACGSVAALTR